MPRFLLLAVLLVIVAPAPAGSAATGEEPVVTQAAGVISVLGLSRIKVHHLSCSIRSRVPNLGRFSAGDSAAIACKDGVLKSIKHLTPPPRPGPSEASTTTTVTTATSTVVSGQITSPTITTSATGTITALDSTGITVGSVTCPFSPGFYPLISQDWHVGDVAYIGCGNGVVIVGPGA